MNDNINILFPPEREFSYWRIGEERGMLLHIPFCTLRTSDCITYSKINSVKIIKKKAVVLFQSRDDGDLYLDGGTGVGKKQIDYISRIS